MTATHTKLVERLLEDIHCERAKTCYTESRLMRDIEEEKLSDAEIREAFTAHTRDCPFESGFAIAKPCSCPFCNAC